MTVPSYPILSCIECADFEARCLTSEEATRSALFQAGTRIGKAIAEDFEERANWPEDPRILILAGKGLNTADALVAVGALAELLPLEEVHLDILRAVAPEEARPLVQEARNWCAERVSEVNEIPWSGTWPERSYDLILDGLLGQSFKGALRDPYGPIITAANEARALMKASIDLPSGLGDEPAETVFAADFTYMAGLPKAPVVQLPGHPGAGRIRLVELDFVRENPPEIGKLSWVPRDCYRDLVKWRDGHADKRQHGHALLVVGSPTMPGAALMSASGAVQSGAGLVSVVAPANIASRLSPEIPEVMWQPVPFTPEGGIDNESIRAVQTLAQRAQCLLIGPGLRFDKPTQFAVCRMVREVRLPLILDASALYQDVMAAVWGRPDHKLPVVITPHEGEYQRLIGPKGDTRDPDALLQFAEKHNMIVVVKGPVTRICDGKIIYHLAVGGPTLARGGTGDILAGMLAATIAQAGNQVLEAVIRTVAWHGAAAEELARQRGQIAVRTTELLPMLSAALR